MNGKAQCLIELKIFVQGNEKEAIYKNSTSLSINHHILQYYSHMLSQVELSGDEVSTSSRRGRARNKHVSWLAMREASAVRMVASRVREA